MFRLIRKSYYKAVVFWGTKVINSLNYDYDKMSKILEKEPSLFSYCDIDMLGDKRYMNALLSNPNFNKEDFADYLISKIKSNESEIASILFETDVSKDPYIMERLVRYDGRIFSFVSGDLANDRMYNLACNSVVNKFDMSTKYVKSKSLSESSIRWWYSKDKLSIFEMLKAGNQLPFDLVKDILLDGNFTPHNFLGFHLGYLSKEEILELAKIDGRIIVAATGNNFSLEAYHAATTNSDPDKCIESRHLSLMHVLNHGLDEETFLELCREDGNFFMFFKPSFNIEEAYKIAMNNPDKSKRFNIDYYFDYLKSSRTDLKLLQRLINLDGRFLGAASYIDLDLYRKAKANGFNLREGFSNDKIYYWDVEDNISNLITLVEEEPDILNYLELDLYDKKINEKFISEIIRRRVDFPFSFEMLETIKSESRGAYDKLINYYKESLENNSLSKERMNFLFNYYSNNKKDSFYKFLKAKVCERYKIEEDFLDYHLRCGSRVNKDFGVTLNPEMLQKKYCVLYDGRGHNTYNKLYILGTFPSIQKKITDIGKELDGESLGNSSRRIELLKKMIDSAIGSEEFRENEEWIPKFSHIVQYVHKNIPMFSYFADHLDELDDKQIALLTSHALSLHKFTIDSMDELKNYDEVRRRYIEKKYAEGSLNSVKEAFIEEYFGMSPSMYKRMMMFKTGVLEARDKYDPEIVKLFESLDKIDKVKSLEQFLHARKSINIEDLRQFYSENNFRYLHLMMGLKQSVLSAYNESLYHVKDGDEFIQYEGCRFYKAAGEDGSKPFNLSITSLGAYSSFDPFDKGFSFKDNWNMPLVASHGICSSYLGNNNLGTARVDCVILGFTDYEEGALLTGGPYDLASNASNRTFDAFSNLGHSMFLHPKQLIDYTRHTHNEYVFERRYNDGKRQPNYAVLDVDNLDQAMALYEKYSKQGRYVFNAKLKKDFSDGERTKEERIADLVYFALKCSKDFGIPIVVVEREKIAQNEWKKIAVNLRELMDKKDFSREEVHDIFHDIFVEFENNAVGNTYHKEINDSYFNPKNSELIVNSIKSKITVLMRTNPVAAEYFLDELEDLCSKEIEKISLFRKNRSNSGIDYRGLSTYVGNQRNILNNSIIAPKFVDDLLMGKILDDDCLMEYSSHFKARDDQMNISDVRKMFDDDTSLSVKFNLAINMMDTYGLYEDREKTAHSRKHVENVVLFSTVVGKSVGLDDKDMDILLAAAVFHDSGRVNDKNESHAVASAKLVKDKLIGVFSKEDLGMIQAIIEYHEVREKKGIDGKVDHRPLMDICEKYGIDLGDTERIERCIRVSNVLKDADALDRTRFVSHSKAFLNPHYLRHDVSKKMFKVAEQLNEYYAKKDIEKTLEEKPELIDTFKEFLDKTHSPKEVIRKYRKGRMNVDIDQKESEVMIDGPKK